MPASNPLSYIVEDLPLRATADLAFEGTLKDALDRTADLFDMTWRIRKSNTVVLEKRFNNPDEHPQFILPELHKIAQDMNVTLKAIPNQSGIADNFYNFYVFYKSLTPDQIGRLGRKEAIGVNDLTDDQRRLMFSVLFCSQYGPSIKAWRDLEVQLAAMSRAALVTSKHRDKEDLLYEYPLRNGLTRKVLLRQFQQ